MLETDKVKYAREAAITQLLLAEKNPHIIMLSPPCLTGATVFSHFLLKNLYAIAANRFNLYWPQAFLLNTFTSDHFKSSLKGSTGHKIGSAHIYFYSKMLGSHAQSL